MEPGSQVPLPARRPRAISSLVPQGRAGRLAWQPDRCLTTQPPISAVAPDPVLRAARAVTNWRYTAGGSEPRAGAEGGDSAQRSASPLSSDLAD